MIPKDWNKRLSLTFAAVSGAFSLAGFGLMGEAALDMSKPGLRQDAVACEALLKADQACSTSQMKATVEFQAERFQSAQGFGIGWAGLYLLGGVAGSAREERLLKRIKSQSDALLDLEQKETARLMKELKGPK